MAKPKPSTPSTGGSKASRRDKLASFEAARKSEQRRRTFGLLAICLVLALGLLAYPVFLFVDDWRARNATLDELGRPVAEAGCDPVAEEPASGNQEHVEVGTQVPYARFPPDSGAHYDTPAPFTKRFYGVDDRPETETLVHNLEHGYLVAWYRADMPEEEIEVLEQISQTFGRDDANPANKFIAAPWQDADGGAFPAGKNLVLTRWTANPQAPSDTAQQRGVRQACSFVSGAAVKDFQAKYPYTASPEPNGV